MYVLHIITKHICHSYRCLIYLILQLLRYTKMFLMQKISREDISDLIYIFVRFEYYLRLPKQDK